MPEIQLFLLVSRLSNFKRILEMEISISWRKYLNKTIRIEVKILPGVGPY